MSLLLFICITFRRKGKIGKLVKRQKPRNQRTAPKKYALMGDYQDFKTYLRKKSEEKKPSLGIKDEIMKPADSHESLQSERPTEKF